MAKTFNFEEAINRIREIADDMQDNEVNLEESLKLFEEGSILIGKCRDYLEKAELRIQKITDKNRPDRLEEF